MTGHNIHSTRCNQTFIKIIFSTDSVFFSSPPATRGMRWRWWARKIRRWEKEFKQKTRIRSDERCWECGFIRVLGRDWWSSNGDDEPMASSPLDTRKRIGILAFDIFSPTSRTRERRRRKFPTFIRIFHEESATKVVLLFYNRFQRDPHTHTTTTYGQSASAQPSIRRCQGQVEMVSRFFLFLICFLSFFFLSRILFLFILLISWKEVWKIKRIKKCIFFLTDLNG